MQDSYGNLSKNRSKYASTTSITFPSKNPTPAIALKGKTAFFVAASMPWSQLMVPRRER